MSVGETSHVRSRAGAARALHVIAACHSAPPPSVGRRLIASSASSCPHRRLLVVRVPPDLADLGIFGAAFLVFADTIARTVIAPSELPIGVVTALIGAVFVIILSFADRAV